jgi:hypothetical protein
MSITSILSTDSGATSLTKINGNFNDLDTTKADLNSPTLITPNLGVATTTSINKVIITEPLTSATVTIANGKTITVSNTLTLAGTDGSTLNIGTGGTLGTAAYTDASSYATTTVGSKATTFTWDGSGGSSGSVTLQMRKIGNWVTIYLPSILATTGTSSTTLANDTAIDAAFRPTATQCVVYSVIRNNGTDLQVPGIGFINSSGFIDIRRDALNTAFSNTASAGLPYPYSLTYYIG